MHERGRIRETGAEPAEIRQVRRNANAARRITRLTGESVVGCTAAYCLFGKKPVRDVGKIPYGIYRRVRISVRDYSCDDNLDRRYGQAGRL